MEENVRIDVLELLPSLINSNYIRAREWMKRQFFFLSLVIRVGKKCMRELFFFFCIEKLIKAALTEVQGKRKKMVLPFNAHNRSHFVFCGRNRMNKRLPSYEEMLDAIVLQQ